MNTYEAKELLANSLRCLAMSMEQIRLREIEKVVGREEPMQDHLAECTAGLHPQAQKLLPAKGHHVKSHDHCMMVVMKFQKEAMTIIEKYGYKTWQDGMYSLPLGYLQSWMEREYWEA